MIADVVFLKELHMSGFKSFAQTVRIELGPGVTAVVGPNGSGKSNIVDAVRWVLGEQSARALRGAKSEDVIFAGSAQRHALGMAEVTMVLTNDDGRIALDLAEVAIARRLYRSGETDYLLNRRRARLRDVLDVAGQAGLGPDSYCVVGQGAIEQLVMQRPQDRRGLIADAADIRRHEARLAEIESDLLQTQQNTLRVSAVVAEIKPQLDRLRTQAERADRHQRVRQEMESVARAWYGRAIPSAESQLAAAERRRLALDASIAEARLQVSEVEARRKSETEAGLALRARSQTVMDALSPARALVSRLSVERAALTERRQALESRISELLADRMTVESDRSSASEKLASTEAALASAPPPAVPGEFGDREASVREAERLAVEARRLRDDALLRAEDARGAIADLEREEFRLRAQAEAVRVVRAGDLAHAQQAKARIDALVSALAAAEKSLAEAQARRDGAESPLLEAQFVRDQTEASAKAAEATVVAATRALDALEAEDAALSKLVAPDQAVADPDRQLLSRLAVPLAWQRAVSAALGQAAGYRVVDGVETTWFDASDEPRAGTLAPGSPMNDFQKIESFRSWVETNLKGHASYRLALDCLQPPQHSSPSALAAAYMGLTLLVDTLQEAQDVATRLSTADPTGSYRFRVATADGQCLTWRGERMLGPDPEQASIIDIRLRRAELEFHTADATAARADAEEKLNIARAGFEAARGKWTDLETQRRLADAAIRSAQESVASLRKQRDRELQQLLPEPGPGADTTLESSLSALRTRLTAHQKDLSDRQAELRQFEAALADAEAVRGQAIQQHNSAQAEQAVASERVARLKEAVARDSHDVSRLTQLSQRLARESSEAESALVSLAVRSESIEEEFTAASRSLGALEAEAAQQAAARRQQDGLIEQLSAEFEERQSHLADLRTDHAAVGGETEHARGLVDRLRVELAGSADALALEPRELVDRRDPVPAEVSGLDDDSLQRRLVRAQRDLRSVGSVDYAVLADFETLKHRHTFLSAQLDDLARSEAAIREGMVEVRQRMREQFLTAFEDVNARFKETFRELFRGGDAELLVSGDPDSLQCGVEIVAQPPGKHLHRLATLSGGERALVGAALLLALIGANPSPFCMLDEVDAALDEANVQRFAETIRAMSSRTQFILVTHNRATMEMADAVYGVTMSPGAVSQVLAIRLPDA